MKIGIVSGYFNPIHAGHIDYLKSAKMQCDFLVAIVNNDYQVYLKQSKVFMDEQHRCEILRSIKYVDTALVSRDADKSVCKTIKFIRNRFPLDDLYFFNSGDRVGNNINSEESILCKELKIKYVEISLPKRYSSSELLK
jgi:D-beta-D-heptose 7-phosphate kinase/D-beta-D-heptose 1-phosphate adenosyltransferase